MKPTQKDQVSIFNAALAAVDPYNAVIKAVSVADEQLHVAGSSYDLASFKRIVVVGAGKATARMAQAIESLLGEQIAAGLIVVKDGHTIPLKYIEQVEASHPVPNEAGIEGAQRILDMAHAADETTLVICLLSGGASALLVAPASEVTLQDKQEATQLLLNAGASITELNAVRKHLSAVKGGRLAQAVWPARLLTLIVSDVIGNQLDAIGSGPTTQDNSTFADAWGVITKYGLQQKLPPRVADHLRSGMDGKVPETMKSNDPCLYRNQNVIVASIVQALDAAKAAAIELGYSTNILSDTLEGEAREAAHFLAKAARADLDAMQMDEQHCLLCGGETTVTVHGSGKGGRNQELALAFAMEIEGMHGVSLLSAGTDGGDGPTDATGAMVDGNTAAQAKELGLDMQDYMDNNDSYTFFQQLDQATGGHCHFKPGPTGTNVMDIQIMLLTRRG
jgi:glycerate 2-kinase